MNLEPLILGIVTICSIAATVACAVLLKLPPIQ
jgi:hypothetical protein